MVGAAGAETPVESVKELTTRSTAGLATELAAESVATERKSVATVTGGTIEFAADFVSVWQIA